MKSSFVPCIWLCSSVGENVGLSWKSNRISLEKGLIALTNTLNPSQIGDITELKCQAFLIEQGWNVLVPVGNHQKYDVVIEKNSKFYKIQIKHALPDETGFLVRTKYEVRDNGKVKKQAYSVEDVDYFMTECHNKFYMFPVFGTVETKFWTVSTRLSTQKQAKDFKAEDILSTL